MTSTHTRARWGTSDQIDSVSMTWVAMSASGLRIAITTLTPTILWMVARLSPACRSSTMRGSCGVGHGTQFLLGYARHHAMLNYHRFAQTPLGFVSPELNEEARPQLSKHRRSIKPTVPSLPDERVALLASEDAPTRARD
jgi:hypothetical protein